MSAKDEILRGFPDGINTTAPNWRALLESIGEVDQLLRDQAAELKKQTIVFTADGVNLDVLGANYAVTRPPIGVADTEFRKLIALLSYSPKQIKDILYKLLSIYYGNEYTKANVTTGIGAPYDLNPNDDLILQIDEDPNKITTVRFESSQFFNINAATADEVAAVISRALDSSGASAEPYSDLVNDERKVRLITKTFGPLGHIRILGGQAQRKLQFPERRLITADNTTEFTISTISGIRRRITWTGIGTSPTFANAQVGDYVVFKDPAFSSGNQGTFTIATSTPDYIEIDNDFGVNETATLSNADNLMIFNPARIDIQNIPNYSTIYQVDKQTITVILPAIVPIVRKSLRGSHHFHSTSTILIPEWPGSFVYDPTQPLQIANTSTFTTESIAAGNVDSILNIESTADFPISGAKYIVIDFGKDSQEGPIEYFNKASATQLSIDPAYVYKKDHNSGATVRLLESIEGPVIETNGDQYPVYLTATAPARIDLQNKIRLVVAAGVVIEFIIKYPDDPLYAALEFWHDKGDVGEQENAPIPVYVPPMPW